jgi:hypothetical protein
MRENPHQSKRRQEGSAEDMNTGRIILVIALGAIGLLLFACDAITGGDQPVPPVPVQIPGAPGMPGAPAVPGQPVAPPIPGQPMAPPVPGQPVVPGAPVPGQPVAPPVPGQPAAPPVPGQPAAPPVPGQPVPGQPAAPPAPAAPTPPTPTGDTLTDALNQFHFEKAPDKKETSTLLKQELKKGKTQEYHVQLPGTPYCQSFIAVGDDNVKDLDLKLESPEGATVGQDSTDENKALLDHCAQTPGNYKLTVTMDKGAGEFAIQVFSKSGA